MSLIMEISKTKSLSSWHSKTIESLKDIQLVCKVCMLCVGMNVPVSRYSFSFPTHLMDFLRVQSRHKPLLGHILLDSFERN